MQAPVSQGFNRFAYAFNSPHNYVDPSGFNADPTTVGIDAGIAGAYGTGGTMIVHAPQGRSVTVLGRLLP